MPDDRGVRSRAVPLAGRAVGRRGSKSGTAFISSSALVVALMAFLHPEPTAQGMDVSGFASVVSSRIAAMRAECDGAWRAAHDLAERHPQPQVAVVVMAAAASPPHSSDNFPIRFFLSDSFFLRNEFWAAHVAVRKSYAAALCVSESALCGESPPPGG